MNQEKLTNSDLLPEKHYELVPLGDVQPHPRNPRRGDVAEIVQLIRANGFRGAITVQRSSRFIIAGNHRWLAARELGMERVPVIWEDCDDATALRHLLADNRSSDLAAYDDAALAELLQEIQTDAGTLDGTAYDDAALDTLLAELSMDAGPAVPAEGEDEAPEPPATPVTVPGDVWLLGTYIECPHCRTKNDV